MGSRMTLDEALVISVAIEGILYGFSLLMFIGTMWVLTRKNARCSSNRMAMIVIAILLLVLSTAHMIVDIVRIYEGLVKYRNTFPGGPVAFFADVSQWSYVAENAIYTLHTLVGDGVVIYRCYVVWNSFWVVIIPCLLWCSVAVTGVGSVYNVSQATVNATNVYAKETSRWIASFFASTLLTNLISSGFLAYRIWNVERNVASIRASENTLRPVFYTIIDAAILYSVTLFVTLICFVTANIGESIVVKLIIPIISIAFYMILIRIGLQRNDAHHASTATAVQAAQDIAYPPKSLRVHVSQLSKSDAIPTLLP